MATTFVESCRRGTNGPAHEASLYVKDWGFSVTDIHKQIELWHGGQDRNAPLHHMRWLEQRLPEKEIHLFPDDGHVTLFFRYLEKILQSAGGLA
jgi:pimeloyl-ACP methyl ester carboxylesterase